MNNCYASLLIFICLFNAPPLVAQSSLTDNTLRLDKPSGGESAKISQLSWLAGLWEGEGLGGRADETWSAPAAGTMVGTFRLIKNNKLSFSEFFILMEEKDSLVLRLKHFDPLLNGWEEKDKYVEFKLVRIDGKTAFFDGLTYKLDAEGRLHAIVAMKQKDGTFQEGKFIFQKRSTGTETDASQGSAGQDDLLPPIELPMDKGTVVLEYELEGGFGIRPPPGFVPSPRLRVFADGRVISGRNNPRIAEVEYKISKVELMELLRFVVNEQAFYEITTEGTKRQIEQTGRPIRVADAPTSRITTELVRGKHEVSCYALMIIAKQYSEIEDLQRLDAIHQRCEALRNRACLGDDRQAERLVSQLNKQFKRKHPGIGRFELADLVSANLLTNGNLTASFLREFVDKDGQIRAKFMGGITKVGSKTEFDFREIPIR